ncbi:Acyl-CoA dehydrogenase/oxidase, N-terminal [Sphingomonadaceae bacterium]|jgi:alkylation response protein AidB-like acyl-CoA dehydrogenase
MRNLFLAEKDRAFRTEVRDFLVRELAPRVDAIEVHQDFAAQLDVARPLGEARHLKPMFRDPYRGKLANPGLTHAVIASEEASQLNYAFETTIATTLSCAYPLHHYGGPALRERYLVTILEGRTVGSDGANMETRIRFDASTREWVFSDFKSYISNAGKAAAYIVCGITAPM